MIFEKTMEPLGRSVERLCGERTRLYDKDSSNAYESIDLDSKRFNARKSSLQTVSKKKINLKY